MPVRRRSRLSVLFRLFSLIVVAAAVAACTSQAQPPEPPRPAIVAQPTPAGDGAATYFSGDVRARRESQLGFRVGGKIDRRLADTGTRVEAGQVLAVLDPDDLRLELTAAQAALASAQADAELAQAERDRYAALLERKLISASQFEAQDTALAAATARLEQAQAQLSVTRNQLGYAELRADHAGVVTMIAAEAGQVVAPGQVVATLAHEGDLEVEIALPEAQVDRFAPGTKAQITLWSERDVHYEGAIREIAPDADRASRTYRARVAFTAPDAAVQLGKTARVRFATAGPADQLSIPLAALSVHGEQPAVWTVDPASGQVKLQPVEVAAYREDAVTLAGGVSAEDWLVIAGVHTLHEGQTVRPIDRENRPIAGIARESPAASRRTSH